MTRLSAKERRSALMTAAFAVIEREGLQGATTRAIVAEANMSLASFHYTFASRDEMIRELIASVVANESRAARESLSGTGTIRDILRAGLQAYFELLIAEPQREQAMLELLHHALRTPGLEDMPVQQYDSYFAAASDLLTVAAATARVEWTIPLEQIVRILVTLTDGITLAWLANHDRSAAKHTMDFAADAIANLARPAQHESEH